ncbi:MAG TPA: cytochrome c3 family protein [Bacteroidota bacterium]|nr:cytochrome c3 family protein [Bacteroidota bacterium]
MTPGIDRFVRQTLILAAALVAVMVLTVGMDNTTEPAHASPGGGKSVKFSHPNHVTERGIACTDCHGGVMESKFSADRLIPGHESCQSCHEEAVNNDCAYCHVDPDNIGPSVSPERDLVFAHETHAKTGGIACETCHGGGGGDAADTGVPGAMDVRIPEMAMCVDCHSTGRVSNECETCHRDFVKLVPGNHLVSGFMKEHDRPVRVGKVDVDCAACHRESLCQECHTGDQLRGFGGTRGLMTVPGARTPLKDSPDALRLQAAHDLNYRFTHPVDARSRLIDCSTCHDRQMFCADCHEAGGIVTEGKIKPQSHFEAGFVMIGAGSGGGRHAEMGRRDIESCVSCHDVEGKDPTCILCHSGR